MDRRRFLLTSLAGAVVRPLAAEAQQPGKQYRIGYLETGTLRPRPWDSFRERLRGLGYIEEQTVTYEARWADGQLDRLPKLAAELVRLKVDVIVTAGSPAASAAKDATKTIPIVMATGGDPVGLGLVASLARPGGNVTGLTTLSRELSGKRLELLREAFPRVTRMGMLWHRTSTIDGLTRRETEQRAQALGIPLTAHGVDRADDFDRALSAIVADRAGAVVIATSPLFFGHRRQLADLALKHRLPTIFAFQEYAEAGGLMAYGPSYTELFQRAAEYVDKVLKGARPADLPIEQPAKFELVINLKTAKALGLTIPPSLLARAGQVIEQAHSAMTAPSAAFEETPWREVQRAAWGALHTTPVQSGLNAALAPAGGVVAGSELVFPVRRRAADGHEAWMQVLERAYEGYVGKDEASAYEGGPTKCGSR